MNKEQEQIIDEVYENFIDKTKGLNLNLEINKDIIVVEGPIYHATPRLLSQEEFINKCKTNPEFSNKWGLKIEERELSLEERKQIVKNKYFIEFYWKIVDEHNNENTIWEMNKRNIPTRLITLTYNNEKIESYE